MSNADPQGKFVWHELLTADTASAAAFYTRVVAWKTQSWEQDPSYTMWVGKHGPVGGVASLGESGAPHWLAFIGVPDVSETVAAAKAAGARVVKDSTSLPNGGTYAVLADPQGAEFGIHATPHATNSASAPGAGDFTWHELATSDAKAAMDFYTKLFGWEVGPVHDMGPMGHYHLFLRDGNQYGGMYVSNNEGGPSWLCYIGVEDAGKAVAAAKGAGGRVLNGPMEVPGGSWVAQVLDKEGAAFAVHEPQRAAAAKPAKPAKPKAEKPAAAAPSSAPAAEALAEAPSKKPATPAKPAAKPAAKTPAKAPAKAAAKSPAKAPAKAAKKAKKKATPAKAKAKGKKPLKKPAKKSAAKGKAKVAAKKAASKKKSAPARKKGKAKKHK